MSNKTITFGDFVCEFENWILEMTCYLIFVISNSVQKLVLECFYRVWQKITCQLLKLVKKNLLN